MNSLKVRPGKVVEVIEKAPLGGPITIRIEGENHALSQEVASLIKVKAIRWEETSEDL